MIKKIKHLPVRRFGKEHPLISRVAVYGSVGCFIATLRLVHAAVRIAEAVQEANPTYPLPTSYCESPPAKIEGRFSGPRNDPFSLNPLDGLGIQGTTKTPVDGVRIRLQRTLSEDMQKDLPFVDTKRPVFESEMLPATDQSFHLRLAIDDRSTEILGITAIVKTTPGDSVRPAGCEIPPTITSVLQGSNISAMAGNHIDPSFRTFMAGGI